MVLILFAFMVGNLCPPPNLWTQSCCICFAIACWQRGAPNFLVVDLFLKPYFLKKSTVRCIWYSFLGLEESSVRWSPSTAFQICSSWAIDHPRLCFPVKFTYFLYFFISNIYILSSLEVDHGCPPYFGK